MAAVLVVLLLLLPLLGRAVVLEMIGDLPEADVKPPSNMLFVCKLNPVTTEEDLEIIFSRWGAGFMWCELMLLLGGLQHVMLNIMCLFKHMQVPPVGVDPALCICNL